MSVNVRVDGVNCTQGNFYKKVGTVAGLAATSAAYSMPYSKYIKLYKKIGVPEVILDRLKVIDRVYKNPLGLMKGFIKGKATKSLSTDTGFKLLDNVGKVLKNSKFARIAYVVASIAMGTSFYAYIGGKIGSAFDKKA